MPDFGTKRRQAGRAAGALLPVLAVLLQASRLAAAEPAARPPDAPLGEILVLAPTPLVGVSLDIARIPGVVQSLVAADLRADGSSSLSGALDSRLSSISVTDTLDDQFQPDIYYRGFAASPVLGTAQGLAVFQNGVRINEAFGDTVNWDLIPDLAISRVDLVSANPLYGLNALGGALTIRMKDGFDATGGNAEISGGSFNRRSAGAQYGANDGRAGIYVAARLLGQDGWRAFAHDSVRQFYSDLSLHTGTLRLDLSLSYADTRLNGQGAAPAQELAVSPQLTFTNPQLVHNRVDFLTLNASGDVTPDVSLQGVAYLRDYRQFIANGNQTSYLGCTAPGEAGLLCQGDGITLLHDTSGSAIANPSQGGQLPLGETDLESLHTLGSGVSLQLSDTADLHGQHNLLTAGLSFDAAHVTFDSSALPGIINAALWVIPAGPTIATGEGSGFSATPVALQAANRHTALYATDTLDFGSRVAVTASGRYNMSFVGLSDQHGTALTGDSHYAHLDPALGATWQLGNGVTAYGNYAGSSRAPTASEIECSDPRRPCLLPATLAGDPPTLRQVIASTIELGLRGRQALSLGSATWNLAVFRTGLHDDIGAIATSNSTGYYQNIGATRREGLESGLRLQSARWQASLQWSLISATFRSKFTEHSASNPYSDAAGNILVRGGDRLPGIPRSRFKFSADRELGHGLSAGLHLIAVGSRYYVGDESNQSAPLPAYRVIDLQFGWHPAPRVEFFASLRNAGNASYASYGLYGDPTGVGAPGVSGTDRRFQSPAAPRAAYAGVRLEF